MDQPQTSTCTRRAARRLDRNEWPKHPRYPSQVLLIGSHVNFRRISKFLVDMARSELEAATAKDVVRQSMSSLFERWQAAMAGGHEPYEEYKLYPYLEARFSVSLASLRRGHEGLDEHRALVREAFASGDDELIRTTVEQFDEELVCHLDEEEEMVIPLLLELSPEEFEAYVTQPLGKLLQGVPEAKLCEC